MKADFGRIICAVIKEYGTRREPTLYTPVFYKNDIPVLLRLKKRLEQFDICVTHYGKGFDIPFLNTKLLLMGEPRIKKMFHVDTYYIARNKLRAISRKSLKRLGDTLQLNDQKMDVSINIWNKARDGDKEAIDFIGERCLSDVRMTEQVYDRFLKSSLIDTIRKY